MELEELGSSGLPPEWLACASCYALLKQDTRAEAVRRLLGGSDELIRSFWKQLEQVKAEIQRRAILAPLLTPADGPGVLLLGRSLQNRCAIRAETLEWILHELDALSPNWADFWNRNNHLGHLVEVLLPLNEGATPVWSRLVRQLTPDLLSDDAHQKALLATLFSAKERAGQPFPEAAAQRIADWAMLREHFVSATAVPVEARQPIIEACNRLGLDPVDLLRRYFERFLTAREMGTEQLGDFAGFFHNFHQPPSWFEDHERLFAAWTAVVSACPDDSRRATVQGYYLEHQVPAQLRGRLADQERAAGRLLPGATGLTSAPGTPASQTPKAAPAQVEAPASGLLFVATGLNDRNQSTPLALVRAASWMLVSVVGGCLAAVVFGLGALPARTVAVLAPFLPLVIASSQASALFACVLAGQSVRRGSRMFACLGGLLVGVGLGSAGAALAVCLAVAQGATLMTAVWLGVTVVAGVTGGLVAGLALPLLISAAGFQQRIAAGPLVQAIATVASTGLFVAIARWLL